MKSILQASVTSAVAVVGMLQPWDGGFALTWEPFAAWAGLAFTLFVAIELYKAGSHLSPNDRATI